MSRRHVEHGANHDLIVLIVAATLLAAAWAISEATDYDEPAPAPTPSPGVDVAGRHGTAGSVSRGSPRPALPRAGAPEPSGGPKPNGEVTRRPAVGTPWHQLAMCESTNNPHAISPDGTYRGLYQFDFPTWRSVGGTGDPATASRTEQLRRAITLQARRGWSPWPQCATKLGLLP